LARDTFAVLRVNAKVFRELQVRVVPTVVLVDPSGTVRGYWTGASANRILNESSAPAEARGRGLDER
jgi:type IV secretory pathway TrbF-like protein